MSFRIYQPLDKAWAQLPERTYILIGIFLLSAYRIQYPDPAIKPNDTIKIDLSTGKITDFIKFDTGVIAMVTGGRNMGRVGVITHRERHDGGFNIVHIKDAVDNEFATREGNVFIIGREKPWISLPKGKGVKVSAIKHSLSKCGPKLTCPNSSLLLRSVTAVGHTPLPATKCQNEKKSVGGRHGLKPGIFGVGKTKKSLQRRTKAVGTNLAHEGIREVEAMHSEKDERRAAARQFCSLHAIGRFFDCDRKTSFIFTVRC